MNDYERLAAALKIAGIPHFAEVFEPGINYYGFPPQILQGAKWAIGLGDGELIFDADGKFIALGFGDEHPGYELRES